MRINITHNLLRHQLDTFNRIFSGPKYTVIKAPRRRAKSRLTWAICLAELCKGYDVLVVEPTNPQAASFAKEFSRCGAPFSKTKMSPPYSFTLGSGTLLIGSHGSSYIGLKFHTIIVDEAYNISDDWLSYHIPCTSTYNDSHVILVSTPRTKSGVFWDWYNKNSPQVQTIDWCSYKGDPQYDALVSQDDINFLRSSMSPFRFRTEYEGEFADLSGAVYGVLTPRNQVHTADILGIDPARTNESGVHDPTGLAFLDISSGHIHGMRVEGSTDPKEDMRLVADIIKNHPVPLKAIVIESNSHGVAAARFLKDFLPSSFHHLIRMRNWSNSSKNSDVEAMQVELRAGTVSLGNDLCLLEDFAAIEPQTTPSGKVTYNAAQGSHDDVHAAACHALSVLHSLSTGSYTFT